MKIPPAQAYESTFATDFEGVVVNKLGMFESSVRKRLSRHTSIKTSSADGTDVSSPTENSMGTTTVDGLADICLLEAGGTTKTSVAEAGVFRMRWPAYIPTTAGANPESESRPNSVVSMLLLWSERARTAVDIVKSSPIAWISWSRSNPSICR